MKPAGVVFLKVVRHPAPCITCAGVVDGRSKAGGFWVKGKGLVHTACAPREWFMAEGSCLECGNGAGSHTKYCSAVGGCGFAPGWVCECGHKGKDHRAKDGSCVGETAGAGAGRMGIHTTGVCYCRAFKAQAR